MIKKILLFANFVFLLFGVSRCGGQTFIIQFKAHEYHLSYETVKHEINKVNINGYNLNDIIFIVNDIDTDDYELNIVDINDNTINMPIERLKKVGYGYYLVFKSIGLETNYHIYIEKCYYISSIGGSSLPSNDIDISFKEVDDNNQEISSTTQRFKLSSVNKNFVSDDWFKYPIEEGHYHIIDVRGTFSERFGLNDYYLDITSTAEGELISSNNNPYHLSFYAISTDESKVEFELEYDHTEYSINNYSILYQPEVKWYCYQASFKILSHGFWITYRGEFYITNASIDYHNSLQNINEDVYYIVRIVMNQNSYLFYAYE